MCVDAAGPGDPEEGGAAGARDGAGGAAETPGPRAPARGPRRRRPAGRGPGRRHRRPRPRFRVRATPTQHPRTAQVHAADGDDSHSCPLLPLRVGLARHDPRPNPVLRLAHLDFHVLFRAKPALRVPDLTAVMFLYIPECVEFCRVCISLLSVYN